MVLLPRYCNDKFVLCLYQLLILIWCGAARENAIIRLKLDLIQDQFDIYLKSRPEE